MRAQRCHGLRLVPNMKRKLVKITRVVKVLDFVLCYIKEVLGNVRA